MSIISQIGVVILIAFIVLVLIRSNKNLKKASEEGENFVDEWALRQEKKEEIKQKREEKKYRKSYKRNRNEKEFWLMRITNLKSMSYVKKKKKNRH